MSITNLIAKYSNVEFYAKAACCVLTVAGLYGLYYYKVKVPYNNLETRYHTLRDVCDKAPVECIQIGRDTIQSNMQTRIKNTIERIQDEEPIVVVNDVNDTTFNFSF